MSMYNDIDWSQKGHEEMCKSNSSDVAKYARTFPEGHWSFLRTWISRKMVWYARPQARWLWNKVADEMLIIFAESGHHVFRGMSVLFRGSESKGGGKTSVHHNAEPATAVLLSLRIIFSVNQLRVHAAVADWCQEFAQQIADDPSSGTEDSRCERGG